MKNKNLLLLTLTLLIISCDNNSKQILVTEGLPEVLVVTEKKDFNTNDTIIYADEKSVFSTPYIKDTDAKVYFRENNRYKDWDKNNKMQVVINYSTLKDGTNINLKVRKSSGIQKLDYEAVRLMQNMKYEKPAMDRNNNPINVEKMANVIFFPPQ